MNRLTWERRPATNDYYETEYELVATYKNNKYVIYVTGSYNDRRYGLLHGFHIASYPIDWDKPSYQHMIDECFIEGDVQFGKDLCELLLAHQIKMSDKSDEYKQALAWERA